MAKERKRDDTPIARGCIYIREIQVFARYMCLQDTCIHICEMYVSTRYMCLQDTCVYEIHVSAFVRFTCNILYVYHTDMPTRPDPTHNPEIYV